MVSRLSRSLLVASAVTLSAATASAQQTYLDSSPLNTWNTTDANWGAGTTWVNNGAATFAGTGESVTVGTVSVTGLTFSSAGYTLTGGTITSGGGFTVNESATINSAIALGAAQSWSVASGKTLTLGGVVSGSNTLTYGGAGNYILGGVNTNSGNLTIDTATVTVNSGATLYGSGLGWSLRTVTLQNGGTLVAPNFGNGAGNLWGQIGDGSNNIVFGTGGGTFRMTGATMDSTVNKGFTVNVSGATGRFVVASGLTSQWLGANSSRDFNADAGATLEFAIDGTFTTSRYLRGAGSYVKSGSGSLTLTNTSNSFTGNLAVTGGTLTLTPGTTSGYAGPLGAGGNGQNNVTIAQGATLVINTNRGTSYHRGNVTLNGGTLTVNGQDNSLASGRAITFDTAAGTLGGSGQVRRRDSGNSVAVTAAGSGSLISVADLNLLDNSPRIDVADGDQDADLTISGGISGSSLNKFGAGKLVLSGSSLTYNGGTFVNAGTVQVGAGGTTGMLPGNVSVAAGASVAFNRSDDATYSGAVTGSGSLSKAGNGVLTLTGANNPLGGTTLSAGTLSIGGGSTSGSLAGDIANNAALRFDRSDALTYGGVVSGTGSVTKQGAGALTLSGANTYTGATTVSAGTLTLTGSLSADSALTVASGATLSGSGSATGSLTLSGAANGTLTLGAVTVADGGVLTPGSAGTGTLTMSSLTFGATAGDLATVNLGITAGVVTSGLSVTGALSTLGGAGSVTFAFGAALSTLTQGSYQLVDYTGGSFSGSVSDFAWSGTKGGRQDLTFSSVGDILYLDVANSSPIWNGSSNQWSATGAWDPEGGGDSLTFEAADTVRFEGAGDGTVELTADVAPASVTVTSDTTDYTFGSSNGSGITGAGIIVKSGASTLTLASANGFSGGVTLTAGGLRVGDDAALGSGVLALNGGVFASADTSARALSNAVTVGGDVTLGAAGTGALTVSGSVDLTGSVRVLAVESDVTLSGVVSNGGLTKSGDGTLTLSGASTFSGAITVAGGALEVAGTGQLGGGAYAGAIDNAAALRFSTSSNQTLSGVVSGAGSLAKSGSGTLTLSGANTYTGKTAVTGGAISVAADSGLGAAPGSAVADQLTLDGGELRVTGAGQTLAANRGITLGASGGVIRNASGSNVALVVAGGISGAGGLTLWSTGDTSASGGGDGGLGMRLTGTNTFVGDVVIRSGLVAANSSFGDAANRIVLNGGGLLDSTTGVTLARSLDVQGSSFYRTYGNSTSVVSGALTGSGTLTRTDGGNLVLSGDLSGFTGTIAHAISLTTTLSGSSAGLGSGSVVALTTGTLEFAAGRLGSGTVQMSGGTLRWATGNTTDVVARLALQSGQTANLNTNGNNVSLATGFGSQASANVSKVGNGILTLASGSSSLNILYANGGDLRVGGATVTLGGKLSVLNGTFSASSGTLSAASVVTSDGSGANSTVNLSGGLVQVTGTNNDDSTNSSFLLGHWAAPTTLNITGGELRSLGANMILGWDGSATVNQSGGTANLLGIRLGPTRTNSATYNLTGGRLNLGANGFVSATANKTINLGAGTLGALADWSSAQGMVLTASSGDGATIDTADASTGAARTITVSGVLSGSGKLTKVGNGTLTLSAINSFSGGLVVSGGTVAIAAATSVGNASALGSGGNAVTVNSGARLHFTGANNRTAGYHTGAVTLNGGRITFDTSDNSLAAGNTLTFATSAGTLDGSGQWRMRDGAAKVMVDAAASGSVISVANLTLTTNGGNHTFEVADGSAAADLTISGAIVSHFGNERMTKTGSGNLLLAGAASLGGGLTVSAGTVTVGDGGSVSGNIANEASLVFDTAGTLTYSGVLSGAGSLSMLGAGSLTLSGTNSFSGGTTLSGGTLVVGSLAALGSGAVTLSGGTLDLGGFAIANVINLAGGEFINAAPSAPAVVVTGSVSAETLNALASSEITLGTGASVDLSQLNPGKTLVLTGAPNLSGLGSFSGTLAVAGALDLSTVGNRPGQNATLEVRSGGSLNFGSGTDFTGTVAYKGGQVQGSAFKGTLSVSDENVALTDANIGGGTVVVGNGASVDVSSFTGALRLTGAGAVSTGLSTFSGSLELADGAELNLTDADAPNADLVIADGGTLRGSGSLDAVTLSSGGLLAPGNSPGIQNYTTLTLTGGGFEFEILNSGGGIYPPNAGTDYDTLVVAGLLDISALSLANQVGLTVVSLSDLTTDGDLQDFDPSATYAFDLISYGSISSYEGSISQFFDLDTTGLTYAGFALDPAFLSLVDTGTSIQLQYSPIPEPSTYGLMLGGLALAGAAIRRRRRNSR